MATRKKATETQGFEVSSGLEVMAGHEEGVTFDLVDHAGRPMHYTSEAGERKRVSATVLGRYAPAHQEIEREIRERRWADGRFRVSEEEQQADEAERLSRALLRWEGFTRNGEPLEPTPENCLPYLRLPWIRAQFVAAEQGRIGFFGNSSGD